MTHDEALDLACKGPPVKMTGHLTDIVARITQVAGITEAVVGQLKVAGLSAGDILSVLVMIGTFISEHGDDVEKIVAAVLELFGRK